ncbi:MAG TPA: gluconokinase [Chitinophagaceae bacterium]|nr:gluconokinase [Chitinophagaceae bacterium]
MQTVSYFQPQLDLSSLNIRPSMDYIIGVDIGTSGTKALAYTTKGKVLTDSRASYPHLQPRPRYSEQDPEIIIKAVVNCIAEVTEKTGRKPLGIGFSAAMHGLMAVNAQGKPMMPLITWADTRSIGETSALRSSPEAAEIYRRTGTPIHPMSPLCKLLWLRKHHPGLMHKAYKFISIKEYLFFLFFGEFVIDHSIASATGLFDTGALKWYSKALNIAGITPAQLSRPVPTDFILKGLKKRFRDKTGLTAGTPFVIGASDGCLANLGTGAMDPKTMAVTIGTSGAVRVAGPAPLTDPAQRIFNYILSDKVFISGGPVNSGGVVLEWFNRQFLPGKSVAQVIARAMKTKPGAEGLLFLPYIQGERAPIWDPQARGVFFGIDIRHQVGHFARAVLEGITYNICGVQRLLEQLGKPAKEIRLSGGMIRSRAWAQLITDMLGRPAVITSDEDASATGAAMMAMAALQLISSLEKSSGLVRKTAMLEPANSGMYKENLQKFFALYDRLKSAFN